MNSIAERLKEERARLGYTQDGLASKGGVQRRAQASYESGDRKPDAGYLAGIADVGIDVGYVITGRITMSEQLMHQELEQLSSAWEAIVEALQEAQKALPADKMRLAAEALYRAVKEGEGQAKPLARLLTEAA